MASMNSVAWPEINMKAWEISTGPEPQGVVLAILDVNNTISAQSLTWALGHVARKGDALKIVGILTHIVNPSKLPAVPPATQIHTLLLAGLSFLNVNPRRVVAS